MLFQKELQENRSGSAESDFSAEMNRIDRHGKSEMYKNYNLINKKERSDSHRPSASLHPPICRGGGFPFGKASFCASLKKIKKASLTLETAMVMPLFLLGLIAMISFMDVYRLQTEHLVKLCEKAKQAGMYAYVVNGTGVEEITLPDIYTFRPAGGTIPRGSIVLHNTVKVHAWTGKTAEDNSGETDGNSAEEEMVFVTENGGVYHKDPGCSYLDLSISQVGGGAVSSMRNASGEKYHACEICSRNQKPAGTVYVTSSGNRYHNLAGCSGLKRTVRLVKRSQVKGMHACSRCG